MKAAIVALSLGLTGANAPSPKQEATAAGQYCGRLWSNGALVQAITEFRTETDGSLMGTYRFADAGTMTSGTLNEAATTTGSTIRSPGRTNTAAAGSCSPSSPTTAALQANGRTRQDRRTNCGMGYAAERHQSVRPIANAIW